MALELTVFDYKAGSIKVKVGLTWTVLDLKKELEFTLKIPPHRQTVYVVTDEITDDMIVDTALTERSPPGGPQVSNLRHREPELAEWLAKIKVNPKAFNVKAPPSVRSDRDICQLAVEANGMMLQYAHESLLGDAGVVTAALRQNGNALAFAKITMRSDKDVVMAAVQQQGLAFAHASNSLKGDKEVALAAVRENGWSLHWASEELRADPEVVLAAVANKGRALLYAASYALSDREIVTVAVKQDGTALEHVCEDLQADGDVVMWAVRTSGTDALQHASEELKQNRHMLYVATGRSKAPWNSTFASVCAWHDENPELCVDFFDY